MVKTCREDTYILGLLYTYLYTGKKMILKTALDKFYNTIMNNLKDSSFINTSASYVSEIENDIYFENKGSNGEIYYVLYPDIELKEIKSIYMARLSFLTVLASLEDNALDCLGLQKVDNQIKRKDNPEAIIKRIVNKTSEKIRTKNLSLNNKGVSSNVKNI